MGYGIDLLSHKAAFHVTFLQLAPLALRRLPSGDKRQQQNQAMGSVWEGVQYPSGLSSSFYSP